jgi:hypothetical protein
MEDCHCRCILCDNTGITENHQWCLCQHGLVKRATNTFTLKDVVPMILANSNEKHEA